MASDDRLRTTPAEWWRVDTATLRACKQELEVLKRQLDAEQNAILAEINIRGVRGCSGHSTLSAMIFEDFHVTGKEADDRADRVLALHAGVAVGGDRVPPLAPLTAEAAEDGAIGGSQIDAIIRTFARIPSYNPEEGVRGGAKILVDLARYSRPRQINQAGRRLPDELDPDGKEPRDENPKDTRPELRFVKHRNGALGLKGTLDLETYARLKSDLDPMAKPHKATDGVRDSRTQDERYGDAFTDYVRLKTTSRNLPGQAGEATHILITMSYEDLTNDLGEAHLDLVANPWISAGRNAPCHWPRSTRSPSATVAARSPAATCPCPVARLTILFLATPRRNKDRQPGSAVHEAPCVSNAIERF
ncbi:DUF222 domain-containing protein [Amycolatopsis sp. lyj-84]|uniref:DUF222 domain-containing protein n=1 Tax=Amycolatopsis sp. lyj-84 TaxID=2789284 RepID=UPI00397849AF